MSATHAWASTSGTIYRTQDGGTTWTAIGHNGAESAGGIQFLTTAQGWMINAKEVYSTSDGGANWTVKFSLPDNRTQFFGSMWFVSPSTGWIAEDGGEAYYRTTDGGATWTPLTFPPGVFPNLRFLDAQNGFVVLWTSEDRKLYATTDGGDSWHEKFSIDVESRINGVVAVDTNHLWLTISHNSGAANEILRTTDGGVTWHSTAIGDQSINDLEFVSPSVGWYTSTSTVYRSTDGGATWTAQERPQIPGEPYKYFTLGRLAFVDESTGWMTGAYANFLSGGKGFIAKTTTGGE